VLYPKNIENKIGFDKIRQILKLECLSPLGEAYVDRLSFSSDINVIRKLIAQTAEFQKILLGDDVFPSQNYIDVHVYLEHAKIEGAFLDENALWEIKKSLQTIDACLRFIDKRLTEEVLHLKELGTDVKVNRSLIQNIDQTIDEYGKVKDAASPALNVIRKELHNEHQQIRKKLENILRNSKNEGFSPDDVSATIRNGRMVIPVFATNKRKIKGLIHDESTTGQTVYIEPIEVFESNNNIKELENDEKREVIKILLKLTDEIRVQLPELRKAYRFLGVIDFVRAKAKFAIKIEASQQKINENPLFDWRNVFHPLLYLTLKENEKSIVPLSFHLGNENHILVISGPNAGGKSVLLKSIALLQFMHQSGLLVPNGEVCTFGIFKQVFIDIGDEQSLENDLSTYSSHLTNMSQILKYASKSSLVLLDEFGTGTDPQYGGAIAEAILEELVRKKVNAIINTHYSNLKYFAEHTEGVINGAMRYDYEQLTPLYELEVGKQGDSFALEIAQKIGLSPQIINTAKSKVGTKKINLDKLTKELQFQKEDWQRKSIELQKQQANLNKTVQEYAELKEFLEKNKTDLVHQAKLDAKKIILDTKLEAQMTLKKLKENDRFQEQLAEKSRKELAELDAKINEIPSKKEEKIINKPESLKVGDKVCIDYQDSAVYKIVAIKGNEAELMLGEIKTTVKLSRLAKSKGIKPKSVPQTITPRQIGNINLQERMANFSSTIDLRGKRGEEAVNLVDIFLDNALLVGSYELRILHGKGDGILRKLIREHLKRVSFVDKFKDEQIEFGGDGITIVLLK
jgi:DNA mismatch repair protein MutS2